MKINITMLAALAALLGAAPALAQESDAPSKDAAAPADGSKEAATKEELRALAEEVRRLKLEAGLKDVEYQSYGGLGPAASKVYYAPKGLSLGGYGEITYKNELDRSNQDQSDLYRVVLYTGYRFNDRIVFNAEVEYEHHEELAVEFAYLDFLLTPALQLRVGNVLVPVGMVNELHEPPFFNGVFRPQLERSLIPSTWNENGLGLHGQVEGLRYQAYLLTGLDATGRDLSAGSWLRNARTGGGESPSETFAGVLSLAYAAGPVTVGGSIYHGRADQKVRSDATGEKIQADVTLGELHATAQWRGVAAKAIYAMGRLGDAGPLSEHLGLTGNDVLGSRVQGGYAEVAYDLMTLIDPGGEQSLSPFFRYESFDLHHRVPAGGQRDPTLDQQYLVAGLTYKPITQVAIKADWTRRDPKGAAALDQIDLGVGFVF